MIHGYVEFVNDNHYYAVKEDVIEFHIDPPGAKDPDILANILLCSTIGLIMLNGALIYVVLRKRRK